MKWTVSKALWWLWALVVGLLLWVIIIAGAAKVAHAGDFHDMWLGQWKAHTAPFPGWQKVAHRFATAAEDPDGVYAGWFEQDEVCNSTSQDGVTFTEPICAKSGSVVVNPNQSRLEKYATLLHELGHARDHLVLTDADRARFANMMGYNPNPEAWWEPLRPKGLRTPGELYAEANEFCGLSGKQRKAVGYFWAPSGRLDGGVYQWRPTHEQARQVCAMLREG